jgi:hypothetical protein
MKPAEHANLLAIFSWVFAGIQGMVLLLFTVYILFMGTAAVMAFLSPSNHGDASGLIVFGIIILVILLLAVFGLLSMILNIRLGRRLRSSLPPTQRSVLFTSILNFLSFLCGGIMVWPFGIALGVYALIFAYSDKGKAFLSGLSYQPPQAPSAEPYGWQQR